MIAGFAARIERVRARNANRIGDPDSEGDKRVRSATAGALLVAGVPEIGPITD
jgi:hypothetical protein